MGCGDVEVQFKFESEFGIAEWVVFADWIGEVSLIMLGSLELDRGANGLGEVRRGSSKVICVGRLCVLKAGMWIFRTHELILRKRPWGSPIYHTFRVAS